MEEKLNQLKTQERNSKRISSACLIGSMFVMALWGWTPLKNVIPAIYTLVLWAALSLVALVVGILSIYRGIQVRSLKARIEDQ